MFVQEAPRRKDENMKAVRDGDVVHDEGIGEKAGAGAQLDRFGVLIVCFG